MAAQSTISESKKVRKANQEVKEAYRDFQKGGDKAQTNEPMDPNQIRSIGGDLEA